MQRTPIALLDLCLQISRACLRRRLNGWGRLRTRRLLPAPPGESCACISRLAALKGLPVTLQGKQTRVAGTEELLVLAVEVEPGGAPRNIRRLACQNLLDQIATIRTGQCPTRGDFQIDGADQRITLAEN